MPRNLLMPMRSLLCVALLPGALLIGCAGEGASGFDRSALEQAEDLTESLANDLLGFSVAVRDGDFDTVGEHLAGEMAATPFPAEPDTPKKAVKWIQYREWPVPAGDAKVDRDLFFESLKGFAGRYTELDDVRFKVKGAEFNLPAGDSGRAHIKFFFVGRDRSGRRDWAKGTGWIDVVKRGEGPWAMSSFELESLASKRSETDLFSEVALPAGVGAVFPDIGVGKNTGFVSHGAAAADVNGDGLLDIAASGVDQNYLYINEGNGRFRDASEDSLVKFAPTGSGALFLDFDNDGDQDLFFAAVGDQILLENRWVPDKKISFTDISGRAGVSRSAVGFSAVSADINSDGLPDVYVCSYNRYGSVMPNSWSQATNGTPNLLFVNRGDGTFEESAAAWGVDDSRWTYAAQFADIDNDGDQDLYVANDFGENALYRNDGGRFTDIATETGVLDPGFGMGVSFGDYDNDGDLDLHVTNMSSTAGNRILQLLYPEDHEIRKTLAKEAAGNTLFQNAGDGTFRDVTREVGGLSGGWGFGGGFIDIDNDGWEDIYTPNGFVSGKSMKDT